jgi:hypothetical protein
MKSDFSRISFDPADHCTAVLHQQGRVILDSDLNEQSAIHAQFLEALASSLTGTEGAIFFEPTFLMPVNTQDLPGFRIMLASQLNLLGQGGAEITDKPSAFASSLCWISPGHYYAGGLRAENDAWVPLEAQPWLPPGTEKLPEKPADTEKEAVLLFYLDVWERERSWLDDRQMSDAALGAAVDTAMRSQLIWQVRTLEGIEERTTAVEEPKKPEGEDAAKDLAPPAPKPAAPSKPKLLDDLQWLRDLPWMRLRPRLRVRIKPGNTTCDPCRPAFASGWQGLENQLYRIEIHTPEDGKQPPTFKWSRENGSVVAQIADVHGEKLRVFPPQLKAGGFQPGDWVEIITNDNELTAAPGTMTRVAGVHGDMIALEGNPPQKGDKLRRWDQKVCEGGVLTVPLDIDKEWVDIEGGIQVCFEPVQDREKDAKEKDWSRTTFATGDYWVFTARTATADVEWPDERAPETATVPASHSAQFSGTDVTSMLFGNPVPVRASGQPPAFLEGTPAALPPHGVRHRYALLAMARWLRERWGVEDLRRILRLCEREPGYRQIVQKETVEGAPAKAAGTASHPARESFVKIVSETSDVQEIRLIAKKAEEAERVQLKAISEAPATKKIVAEPKKKPATKPK